MNTVNNNTNNVEQLIEDIVAGFWHDVRVYCCDVDDLIDDNMETLKEDLTEEQIEGIRERLYDLYSEVESEFEE